MLKVFGNIYSQNRDDFAILVQALQNDGFQIALLNETNGTIIKEVQDQDEEPEIQW